MEGFCFTYVLTCSDGTWYVGIADDLERRIDQHLAGKVKSTKTRLPVELLYFEGCRSREAAAEREKQLKTGFGRGYLKRRLGYEL